MAETSRFRDAARVHVDVPPDRVRALLENVDVLKALDDRLNASDVEVTSSKDRIEVLGDDDRLEFAFRLTPAEGGTRIAALESVEPEGFVERTKWMLFPKQTHRELESELDRLRHLVEAFEATKGA